MASAGAASGEHDRILSSAAPTTWPATQHAGPPPAIPLLSPAYEINLQELGTVLSDNADFFVLGVIGRQGSGKSSLLNALLGCSEASGHSFPTRSMQHAVEARHCTGSIAVSVQPQERLVAIDTWPLHSASMLLDVLDMDRVAAAIGKPAANASSAALQEASTAHMAADGVLHLMTLQLVLLLLSSCHLLVVMADDLLDQQLLQLLLAADMLAKGLRDCWPPAPQQAGPLPGPQPQRMAEVLLVQTSQGAEGLQPAALQMLQQKLNQKLAGTSYLRPANSYLSCCSRLQQHVQRDAALAAQLDGSCAAAGVQDAMSTPGVLPASSPAPSGHGVNLWVLPKEEVLASPSPSLLPAPAAAATLARSGWGRSSWHQQLLGTLLSWPRRRVWRGATEKEWARGCERAWEQVRSSREVVAFHVMALQTLYSGAGSWRLRAAAGAGAWQAGALM